MNPYHTAREGDRVEFNPGRGGKTTGTVTRVIHGERRKAKRMLSRYGISDPTLTSTISYEVHGDDGRSWRRVPADMAKVIGKASQAQRQKAKDAVGEIVRHNKGVEAERKASNWDSAGDLTRNLKRGDKIKVRFKSPYGGTTVREVTFLRWSTSGRLRVKNDFDREQWVNPRSVVQ